MTGMTGSNPPAETRSGYAPLVPTFSLYTASAPDAVRLAWRTVVLGLALLVAVIVGGPAVRNWYINSAIEPRSAAITLVDGVSYLRRAGARDWIVAQSDSALVPGDTLRTGANARTFVRLFDQSTLLLYPSTTVQVLRAEQGRFRPDRTALVLDVTQGQLRVGVAPSPGDPQASLFQVRTPEAQIHLEEGSYSLEAGQDGTQVRVRLGQATAYAPAGKADAHAGQRLVIHPDKAPQGAQPMRADLLANGWLTQQAGQSNNLADWTALDLSEQEPAGTISLTEIPGAVTFRRNGAGHGETLLLQQPDVDLWDYEKLTLSADLRVFSHSLSGGGWQGTEYPIMLRITYRDATGGVHPWYQGFYLQNPDGYPVVNGTKIPPGDWYHVDVDLLAQVPRPWRIQRVEVVASGWDYASAVREVHLWAE